MKRAFLAASVFALAASASAQDTYVVDKGHSEASFQIRHLVSKVRGRFKDFAGTVTTDPAKPEASRVEFTIKADSIDTTNDRRDADLRSANFFEVEKFPEITFRSTKVTKRGEDRYDVTGDLTMHGVTKPLTLPVTVLGFQKDPWGGQRVGLETAVTLNRKDFGIVWNKVLDAGGTLLGDDVAVTITLEAVKKVPEAPAK